MALDSHKLGLVFESRPDILKGIKAAADSPARVALFNEIASFVYDRYVQPADSLEPASKRRRVDGGLSMTNGSLPSRTNGAASAATAGSSAGALADAAASEEVMLEIKDISLSIPQRKKFDLCFTENHLFARSPNTTCPVQGIVYSWKDIEHAFYLPVPEKAQPQHNYVLFPRGTALLAASSATTKASADGGSSPAQEPLVFTVPATAPRTGTIAGALSGKAAAVSDSYSTLFHWALATNLRGVEIVSADPRLFHSVVRQPHRPAEKAVHVKAFRGSKDGYLFFLPTGILWGFKKPLLFLPLDRVVAVSYTSILQRTFNTVVEVETGPGQTEEVEFGMLDQEDYAGIDTNYVKRHRLQDRSLAEQRRAKRELAENAKKGGDGEEGETDGAKAQNDGLTELERAARQAEQQLQDEEDEEEEDYDPGSEGDSEGEGETSDEEEGEKSGDGEGGEDEGEEEEDDGVGSDGDGDDDEL